jgi:hypothetical protein
MTTLWMRTKLRFTVYHAAVNFVVTVNVAVFVASMFLASRFAALCGYRISLYCCYFCYGNSHHKVGFSTFNLYDISCELVSQLGQIVSLSEKELHIYISCVHFSQNLFFKINYLSSVGQWNVPKFFSIIKILFVLTAWHREKFFSEVQIRNVITRRREHGWVVKLVVLFDLLCLCELEG